MTAKQGFKFDVEFVDVTDKYAIFDFTRLENGQETVIRHAHDKEHVLLLARQVLEAEESHKKKQARSVRSGRVI